MDKFITVGVKKCLIGAMLMDIGMAERFRVVKLLTELISTLLMRKELMVKNISKKVRLAFLGNTSSSTLFKFGLLDLVIFADL